MSLSTSNEILPVPLLTTPIGQGPTLAAGPTLCDLPLIKERLETLCAMESYLPNSDRHAASWIFSDGPRQPIGVVKLRYNALKLFFDNVAI